MASPNRAILGPGPRATSRSALEVLLEDSERKARLAPTPSIRAKHLAEARRVKRELEALNEPGTGVKERGR